MPTHACKNHSMWVWSHNHWNRISCESLGATQGSVLDQFHEPKPTSLNGNGMMSLYPPAHPPLDWMFSNTLHSMFVVDEVTTSFGSRASVEGLAHSFHPFIFWSGGKQLRIFRFWWELLHFWPPKTGQTNNKQQPLFIHAWKLPPPMIANLQSLSFSTARTIGKLAIISAHTIKQYGSMCTDEES